MTRIGFSAEEAVKARSSVRNYADREIEPDKMEAIRRFVEALDNPFHQEVSFHWLMPEALPAGQKLGTYGVIKGAKRFIGASVRPGPLALEALGYEMEALILYLAHLGLGSCWLGGTFNRKGFAKAMEIGEDHLFPAITPVGYGAPKRHVTEKLMRGMIRADRRAQRRAARAGSVDEAEDALEELRQRPELGLQEVDEFLFGEALRGYVDQLAGEREDVGCVDRVHEVVAPVAPLASSASRRWSRRSSARSIRNKRRNLPKRS